MLIGITGGVASGKSRVAELLGKNLDAIIISADEICREQLHAGSEGYTQFLASGGVRFLDTDETIDRMKLREALFGDENLRRTLEQILHPLVYDRIMTVVENNPNRFVIAEVPLLFEAGWNHAFDFIVAVTASAEIRIDRIRARDGSTRQQAMRIISLQMAEEQKNARADYVVRNEGSWGETEKQVAELVLRLKTMV